MARGLLYLSLPARLVPGSMSGITAGSPARKGSGKESFLAPSRGQVFAATLGHFEPATNSIEGQALGKV